MQKSLLILLGDQLFPEQEIEGAQCADIFMAEDFGLCKEHQHHKAKILMFFSAMREKRKELVQLGYTVHYYSADCDSFKDSFQSKLARTIENLGVNRLLFFEIEDLSFAKKLELFIRNYDLDYQEIPSPMFLCSREKFRIFFSEKRSLRMNEFYKLMRRDLNILLDGPDEPKGGKWSFDKENRKKIPKSISPPALPSPIITNDIEVLKSTVIKFFHDHPGSMDNFWVPTNRTEAFEWVDKFLSTKLKNFGSYEDAIYSGNNFLFHSALSPILNMGIITPKEVLEKVVNFAELNCVPLNSVEGFIRQLIGWREFIRGVYHIKNQEQFNSNFWKHQSKLTSHWYDGTTGIQPLDDSIKDCLQFGYTHHIPRLMIIANIMTLARIHPREIYKWFMEMFLDSAEWVMVPNVFGMGTFADGGIFATKPYSCGSNYILKMGNYKKDEWCDIVDGLYWHFIQDNKGFFKSNPRLAMLTHNLDRMSHERKSTLFCKAIEFMGSKTVVL